MFDSTNNNGEANSIPNNPESIDLRVRIGSISLRNPVLLASGTAGYAREFGSLMNWDKIGGIVPKTITVLPRKGNPPPRTVETPCGLLNSIGLDNDGIDYFISSYLPELRKINTAIIPNVAGKSLEEFGELASRLAHEPGITALELNLSCPNVSGGIDFAIDPLLAKKIVNLCTSKCSHPIIAKLTPNITDLLPIIQSVAEAGATAVSIANTFLGMAIDWRKRKPILGNQLGGLSGPAIKPIVLRMVWQMSKVSPIPIIAVGGIGTLDDVMEFLVAGASAVQIGTANFYNPSAATKIVDELPKAIQELGYSSLREVIGVGHQ